MSDVTPDHLVDLCDVLGVDPDAATHITIDRDGVTWIEVTPCRVAWTERDPEAVHHRERPVRDPETADG